jgi:catechol 2,3-dioxygenase-like lactoylglutathione lyase family enzyme
MADRESQRVLIMAKTKPRKASRAKTAKAPQRRGSDLAFNHAMIYAADVARSLAFYESLGFETLETQLPYYARLATGGNSSIALHGLEPGQTAAADGIRLYFETPKLAAVHKRLAQAGVAFSKPPEKQPWGWTHAYLHDPDGHEISLYWAGAQRLKKTRK